MRGSNGDAVQHAWLPVALATTKAQDAAGPAPEQKHKTIPEVFIDVLVRLLIEIELKEGKAEIWEELDAQIKDRPIRNAI